MVSSAGNGVNSGSALLVIDMQNDILRPSGGYSALKSLHASEAGSKIIPNLRRLLDKVRAARIPVLHFKLVFRRDHFDASPRSPSRRLGTLVKDSWGSEIVEELAPGLGDFVIEKHRPSCFYNTELEVILRSMQAGRLIITGASTNIAVFSTVCDAYNRDYEIVVVSDCTAAAEPSLHLAVLKTIKTFFGEVMTSKQVIRSLI